MNAWLLTPDERLRRDFPLAWALEMAMRDTAEARAKRSS